MKTLDSLSHYNYESCENGYTFTTDSGNIYIVSFIDYSTVIPEAAHSRIFSFNIDRVNEENHDNGSENKVRNTILIILRDFFDIYTNAMISVCEMSDGKQEARFRLFSSWEKKFMPSNIKKAKAAHLPPSSVHGLFPHRCCSSCSCILSQSAGSKDTSHEPEWHTTLSPAHRQ